MKNLQSLKCPIKPTKKFPLPRNTPPYTTPRKTCLLALILQTTIKQSSYTKRKNGLFRLLYLSLAYLLYLLMLIYSIYTSICLVLPISIYILARAYLFPISIRLSIWTCLPASINLYTYLLYICSGLCPKPPPYTYTRKSLSWNIHC